MTWSAPHPRKTVVNFRSCQIAWEYQWVKNPIEFDAEICETLYDVSQGITGLMISAFAFAQLAAIDDETERVDGSPNP